MAIRIRTPLPAREQGWVFLVIIVLVVNQLIKGLGFMSGGSLYLSHILKRGTVNSIQQSKERPKVDRNINITYRINPGPRTSLGNKSIRPWGCDGGEQDPQKRAYLHQEMRPFFNFSTSLETNLKIMILGDSLGAQIKDYIVSLLQNDNGNRSTTAKEKVIDYYAGTRVVSTSVVTPINSNQRNAQVGTGAIAKWRVIGMFRERYEGWARPNWNKGWLAKHGQEFRDAVSIATTKPEDKNKTQITEKILTLETQNKGGSTGTKNVTLQWEDSGNFDVFVFRVPSPAWIGLAEVTPETVRESIKLAHKVLGVRVVILVSMHFSNFSTRLPEQYTRDSLHAKNQMLFDFARNWTEAHARGENDSGVHSVFVLDSGRLNDELLVWNAELLGFDTSKNFTEKKFHFTTKKGVGVTQTSAHICGESFGTDDNTCVHNSITTDGIHWCMNNLGPRYAAGLACQLQCVFPLAEDGWACSEICNERFMRAKVMPEETD